MYAGITVPAPPTSFWRTLTRFDAATLTPWLALRNSIGIAIPLIAGALLGNIPAGLIAAIGALDAGFSDGSDPYISRARRMLSATLLVSLAVFAGRACGHNHALSVLLEAACALAAGMMVAAGSTAADIGTITLVTLIVFAAQPAPVNLALSSGLLAFAGGLLQTILALALWPIQPHQPERRVLGALYSALARAAASGAPATEAPPATEAIVQARTALAELSPARSVEGERYLALLSQAERIRLALLTLARLRVRIGRETETQPDTSLLDRAFALAARMLAAIGEALLAGVKGDPHEESLAELSTLSEQLRRPHALNPSPALAAMRIDARCQLDALAGQLRSAVELAAHSSPAGLDEFARHEAAQPWPLRLAGVLAVFRANLNLDSPAFRHALRLAACVALSDFLARGLGWQRTYWAPMTVAIVLKPDFTATFSRGVLRLAGTFAGLAFATALFHFLSPSVAIQIALIPVFAFLMRWLGPGNYGILVSALTALVVMLFAASGVAPSSVIAARAINTVAGGLVALAAYRLWPTWERTLVPDALASMLEGYRAYFQAVRNAYLKPGDRTARHLERVRQASRLSRSHLEASIARLTTEPGVPAARIAALHGILANSHRFIHAVMALETGLLRTQPAAACPAFRTFARDVDTTLYFLAAALRGSRITPADLPDLREDHHALLQSGDAHTLVNVETDRITNSLNTLAEQVTGLL